jgi:uncharacterized repeat protein (TIGR01451 family)
MEIACRSLFRCVGLLAALVLLGATGTGTAAGGQGSVDIEKSVVGLSGPATPGAGFSYQLTAECSSLTVACVGATVTDVLPAGLEVIPDQLPTSNSSQSVSYDAAMRTLKVTFTEPLPPPNPAGSTGLPAGSVRQVLVGVRLPAATALPDGSTITNTGQITADNAAPASSSADVNVSVPRTARPVAMKSWPDSSPVALSGATSRITLGISHASSSSAQVTELSVGDTSPDTFENFDLVSVGPVDRFPAGADQVAVEVCTKPIGSPCAPDEFKRGPFGRGPGIDLPAGVTAADVTGLRFIFRNAAGTTLPADATDGRVSFDVRLRDTVRSTGAPLDPAKTKTGSNCADPAAVESGTPVSGASACVGFSILPNAATIKVDKSFFSDAAGSYSANGVAVAGQSSPVSALTTAKNASPFAVSQLTVIDPSTTAASRFSDFDADSIRVVFPAGATDATVTVDCRDGSSHTIGPLHAPPSTTDLKDTRCPAGSPPARVTVVFTGTKPDGSPAIAAGATATLGLHGKLKSDVAAGRVSDCSDGQIPGQGGRGAATGTGCAEVVVEPPRSTVAGTKSVNGGLTAGQLVVGQPLSFSVSGSNSGNLPDSDFLVQDPADPSAAGNPFDLVQLTDASLSTTPASLRASMAIEVFNPATGAWVPYDSTNPGLVASATGVRVRLVSGTVPLGGQVRLSFSVVVRDGVPVGSALQNCQLASVRTAVGEGSNTACAPRLEVKAPSAGGAVQKVIAPSSVARHLPGVAPQAAQVRIQAQNTGTIPLRRVVVTDTDGAFFDSVDLVGIDAVNFPPGSDRVQIDACTTDCAGGTFINGVPTASNRPGLPAGVAPGDVQGLRFTFTNSSGGYVLPPGSNFPGGAPCPNASICFSIAPRVTLRSNPAATVPASLSDTASAAGESQLQTPGTTFPIGNTTAPLSIVPGATQLSVAKSTGTPVAGPGEPVPFDLSVANSGTGAVPDLVISEHLPAGLVFDQSLAGTGGLPFTITSSVPAGTPPLPAPVFAAQRDPLDPSRIASLQWSFPGFDFLPGSTVKISFRTTLAPGLGAGERVENSFGASSSDPSTQATLACQPSAGAVTDGPYGSGRYCTAKAAATSRGGSALDAQKWVTGDPALGFYNTATDTYVKPGDISCPLLTVDGADYTRFPCIALVLAGQQFHYLLNVTNIGNTPATEVRLVDGLPHIGDTGVKLTGESRDTEWDPRPRLAAAPTLVSSSAVKPSAQFAYTGSPKACTDELLSPPRTCPSGDWGPAFSTDAEGFRAFVTFPDRLAPGKSFAIRVPMSAPVTLHSPPDSLPIAWNSFAHTDFVLKPGATAPSQLPFVEPPKVGVALPFGTLEIDKQKTGPLADQAVGSFTASYDCTVTPAGGSPVSVANGQGTFDVDSPLFVPDVPVGATCSVWETDTGGGVSDHPLPETAITTVIAAQRNGNTTVTLANDFPAWPPVPPPPPGTPAADAQLLVTKHVDLASAAAGQPLIYTIEVANAGPSTATNVRLTDNPSEPVTLAATSVSQGSCSTGLPLTCTLGSLAPGAEATIMVQESANTPGNLRDTATFTAAQATPTPARDTATALTSVALGNTRLRITKTPAFRHVHALTTVTYKIRVATVGPLAAVRVHVCDRPSPDLSVLTAAGSRSSAGRPCWTIPVLEPGDHRTFTVTILAHNVPTPVSAPDTATASAGNAATVDAHAALEITPQPTPTPVTG